MDAPIPLILKPYSNGFFVETEEGLKNDWLKRAQACKTVYQTPELLKSIPPGSNDFKFSYTAVVNSRVEPIDNCRLFESSREQLIRRVQNALTSPNVPASLVGEPTALSRQITYSATETP